MRPRLLSTLGARWIFGRSAALSPRGVGAVGATAPRRAGFPRPLLDAIQQSDQQDVAWKLLHARANQSPALGASEFVAGTDDAQQTPFAERVLTRQDPGRDVEPLQTHRTLQKVQKGRLIHLPLVHRGRRSTRP